MTKTQPSEGSQFDRVPSFVQCSYFRVVGGDGTRFGFPCSWLRRPRFKFGGSFSERRECFYRGTLTFTFSGMV